MQVELVDLHIHVGGAVAPHIMWSLAHQQGMKLPAKTYWDFWQLITASPETVHSLEDYVNIMHQWTEKIQSSPEAIQRCVYSIIAKEYRSSNVSHIELRFNPMKRNKGGEMDLDHIIQAAVHGLDQAVLDYGAKAGLIFCLAREFPYELNEIIVRKAVRYFKWGVVGIDMAGPEKRTFESDPDFKRYVTLFQEARERGLGITVHTGETDATGPESVRQVLRDIRPERIGHGIQAAKDEALMKELAVAGTVLELCPSSNIQTRAVEGWQEFKEIVAKFKQYGVKFTINTDGPYLLRTNMKKEIELLLENDVLTEDELKQSFELARSVSFIK
ncbi:MAG: adenosine deaminase [Candidatus Kerfeldbacteria bacterium]|nr:adenosine deaminase [Candidatus Kerfeldbacteria bacterium]